MVGAGAISPSGGLGLVVLLILIILLVMGTRVEVPCNRNNNGERMIAFY